MSGEVKNDIQHSGESAFRQMKNRLLNLWHGTKLLLRGVVFQLNKYYSNPIKAIKNDGPNKQLSATPLLTREEAKHTIVKMQEYGIIATVKEVDVFTDQSGKQVTKDMPYKGKNLHSQQKMAKNELKIAKWKDRTNRFEKIKLIKNFAERKVKKFEERAMTDNQSSHGLNKRYVFITNQSNALAMNDILAEIQENRIKLKNDGMLPDLNNDGIVDEKDIEVGNVINLSELKKEDLIEGRDFGDILWNQVPTQNSCIHIITKDEFIEKHQELRIGATYAARVYDEEHVKLYYSSQYLISINDTLKEEHPQIIEFGSKGGDTITKIRPNDSIKVIQIDNEKDLFHFKQLMTNQDYIINYENGKYEIQVCESELIEADRVLEKKQQAREVPDEELEQENDRTTRAITETPQIIDTIETNETLGEIEIEKD